MLKTLIELYKLLDKEQHKKLFFLQILVVIMSLMEVASVLAFGPFMTIVGDINVVEGNGLIADIYRLSGLSSPSSFLFWLGVTVLIILLASSFLSMYTIWRLLTYGAHLGVELGNRLFAYYLQKPWLFHAGNSSSQLTKQIAQECGRITNSIIKPAMHMNAKIIMSAFMGIAILIYNPRVAGIGFIIFVSAYFLLYKVVRSKLTSNGEYISSTLSSRYKIMNDGFGGIKDTLLLGRQKIFNNRFQKTSFVYASAQGVNDSLSQVPRYAIELIAYGLVVVLVLYLLATYEGDVSEILPILAVYALAGFKLLPAFQQIYTSIAQIRGNIAAFEAVKGELYNSMISSANIEDNLKETKLSFENKIEFKDVSFKYPRKEIAAINKLNMVIPKNKVIGIVGDSGSGKSTSIDLLLGLLIPDEGQILIDNMPLTPINIRSWQNIIGFVPQSIFLADSTIRENIAFGIPLDEIDESKLKKAVALAHLDGLLSSLPKGLGTTVGERGVQLSGGQRQRIGIARALYNDAEVLVLDEATSSLDGITEKSIMDAIHDFSGKKTIIMIAHRLMTVKKCDIIYFMKSGTVVDIGSFNELIKKNKTFKKMAFHD